MTSAEKLVEHISNCEILSGSLTVTDEKLYCIPCNYTALRNNVKHFPYLCVQHFRSDGHKEKCCWTIERDRANFVTIKLKSDVTHTLDKYLFRGKMPSDGDLLTLNPFQDVGSSYINSVPSEATSPFQCLAEGSLISHSSQPTASTDDFASYQCASTQFSPDMRDAFQQKSIASSSRHSQCSSSFGDGLKDFLQSDCKMKLRKDFKPSDIPQTFTDYPLIRDAFENSLNRLNPNARHSKKVATHVYRRALMHSQRSALDWSIAIGGPRGTSIKNACKADVKILPHLDIKNMEKHLLKFMKILKSSTKLKLKEIPIIAALDATAVTGRLFTRAAEEEDGELRYLYGLAQPGGPFQETWLRPEHMEEKPKLKINDGIIILNGIGFAEEFFKDGSLKRAGSYMIIVVVPLIEKPRPYAIGMFAAGKGFNADKLSSVHNQVYSSMEKFGLKLITCPGDGDPVLRSVQWDHFNSNMKFNWLSEVTVPVEAVFDDRKGNFHFPMQDMLHNIKKLRNNILYTETKCLSLGNDPSREKELMVRWDLVWDLFTKRPELLQHCSLSALIVKDKQDPSLVTDLTRLYKYFFEEGYTALGMYLKCTHWLCEAFLVKNMSPMERLHRAYYAKTFFYVWFHYSKSQHSSLTSQTFYDVCCCVDGLVDYLLTLLKKFPEAPIVTFYLGSDICEQFFAFVRISRYSGRRTNVDADVLSYGLERRNLSSEITDDTNKYVAHTRGRAVLKTVIPLPNEKVVEQIAPKELFIGKDLNESAIRNTIKKATNDCIMECLNYGFDCFERASLNALPRNRSSEGSMSDVPHEIEEQNDDEDLTNEDEEPEEEDPSLIRTPMGKMPMRTAESIFLNGGKLTVPSKSRHSRFYKNIFEGNDFVAYKDSKKCCNEYISRGDEVKLPTFSDSNKQVHGKVKFISRKFTPLKFACKIHTEKKDKDKKRDDDNKDISKVKKFNVWVYDENRSMYVRCVYK